MITSVHNPRIKEVRRLLTMVKARREQGAFVVEGVRLAEEALQSGWEAQLVLCTDQLDLRGKAVVDGFSSQGVPTEMVADEVMGSLSDTDSPQGVLVVMVNHTLAVPRSPDFLLILDGVRDPGNLGTILRTSAAACVQAVLLSPGCADATSPKVLRAAMGAHFHLPLLSLGWTEIAGAVKDIPAQRIYLADSAGGMPYTNADFGSPLALVVGGEAAGAGSQAASIAGSKVHIPMPGGSESLNAAVAAGILIFEAVRQRESRRLEQDMLK